MPETPEDPYVLPNGVLRNLLGIEDREHLKAAEADLVSAQEVTLVEDDLVAHTRDLAELRAIHAHLFQDLYAWAGELRVIDMKRGGDADHFCPVGYIENNAAHVFADFATDDFLRGRDRSSFVDGLTHYYDAINYVHPFRDGNGRTQRLFWSRIALDAGWALDWRPIHGKTLDDVSRLAREGGDSRPLRAAVDSCVSLLP